VVYCVLLLIYRGADELLTVLSYVIIQTQCPDLITEAAAVMDFAREKSVVLRAVFSLLTS